MNFLFINSFMTLLIISIMILPLLLTWYSVINNKILSFNQKFIWVIITLFSSWTGIILYWLWEKKNNPIGSEL